MGSIIQIYHNPNRWKVIQEGLRLKENGEELLKVEIGEFDDDIQGLSDIQQYIRKSVYDKLISGEYTIKSGKIVRLEILDNSGKIVIPYLEDGTLIY